MTSVTLDTEMKDAKALGRPAEIQARLGRLAPVMKTIGQVVQRGVWRNFDEWGRPMKWAGQSPLTVGLNRAVGSRKRLGFHSSLRNSIDVEAENGLVRVGTTKAFAAVYQFGAAKGSFGTFIISVKQHLRRIRTGSPHQVKAHTRRVKLPWGDISARPFLMVQDEDWLEIQRELTDYLLKI